MAYYAILAAKGFLPPDWLDDWGSFSSRLGHHPDRTLIPGVEIGSGSLGHGLPLAVGTVLGLKAQGRAGVRTFVLMGDAELDEGSTLETIAYAGSVGLANLTAIVIDNDSASHIVPGGLATRFTAAGWSASTVDAHDHDALAKALSWQAPGAHVVVAVIDSARMS
jgi:transketolase